jgi:hypothetical protein
MAESEATKVFSKVDGELDTAQHQWNTYADILGAGYTDAYHEHKDALDEIFRARMIGSEIFYFLFSGLAVGLAGGLVGGLMIPYMKKAGEDAAKKFLSEVVRGVAQEAGKRVEMVPARWVEVASGRKTPSDFQPAGNEPMQYYLGIKSELGLCFSRIRDRVLEYKDHANNNNLSARDGEIMLDHFRRGDLLKNKPSTDDMPVKWEVHREAEIGMWIAWSHVFDIAYWKIHAKDATDGIVVPGVNVPTYSLKEYDPIFERLNILGVGHLVSMYVEATNYQTSPASLGDVFRIPRSIPAADRPEKVLNIPLLRQLGYSLDTPFLSRVADIVKDRGKVLPQMAKLPPRHKK